MEETIHSTIRVPASEQRRREGEEEKKENEEKKTEKVIILYLMAEDPMGTVYCLPVEALTPLLGNIST